MTILEKAALACALGSSIGLHASNASNSSKSLAADNVVQCQLNTGCFSKDLFGRTYRVIQTPRFTVMASISREGIYTRADLSIINTSGLPLNLMPDDFRVETVASKPQIFTCLAPRELHDVPVSPAIPAQPQQAPAAEGASIDQLYAAAKQHEVEMESFNKVLAAQYLGAAVVAPDQTARGRVYFDQDKHARQINLILPIAGQVFEFPFDTRDSKH